jgi:hypothetical protein
MHELNNQYRMALSMARHIGFAHRERAVQLTKTKRFLEIVSLAIAPFFILSAVNTHDKTILTIAISIAGTLSLLVWVVKIIMLVQKIDKQLQSSIELPIQTDKLISDLKSLGETVNWGSPTELESERIRNLIKEINRLHDELEKEQIYVEDWMNLIAQQRTMKQENLNCAICSRPFNDIPFSKSKSKTRIKEIKKDVDDSKYCHTCGQERS